MRPFLLLVATCLIGVSASAQQATLTLDGLSFVSFQDQEIVALPPGSTIEFTFGPPAADGSVPFTIDPRGVTIPDIALTSSSGRLHYALSAPAKGRLLSASSGLQMEFTAPIAATLTRDGSSGTVGYAIRFTTESVSATSADGRSAVQVSGMRVVGGANYVQLAGATTNQATAYPKPGTAVYAVLSGTFDQLPPVK